MIRDVKERAEEYLHQSLKYLENAEKFLDKQDPEKAGEFLWGSVATAFKALVMAKKGEEIRSHAQFWDIARELARETGDESLYKIYKEANQLHCNFYDSKLTLEDIKMSSANIAKLVKKLMGMTRYALEQATKRTL